MIIKIVTIKQHKSRFMRTYEGTPSNDRNKNEDRNAPIAAYQLATNSDTLKIDLIAWWRLVVLQLKRRDLHHKWLSWEKPTNFVSYLTPRWTINTYFITLLSIDCCWVRGGVGGQLPRCWYWSGLAPLIKIFSLLKDWISWSWHQNFLLLKLKLSDWMIKRQLLFFNTIH